MKITAILLTLLYAASALAGQPYVQPMEPSNDDNVTLLPAPGGKVILDGDAYFRLPDGNKRSLRGLDGTVNDLTERFESNSSKLRYDNMPNKIVADIHKNGDRIDIESKKVQSNINDLSAISRKQNKIIELLNAAMTDINMIHVNLRKLSVREILPDMGSDTVYGSCGERQVMLESHCAYRRSIEYEYFPADISWERGNKTASCKVTSGPNVQTAVIIACIKH